MKPAQAPKIAAILLAGGRSLRLFPFNKVLSDLTGTGKSLIQEARGRLKAFPKDSIYVLTTTDMAPAIRRQLTLSPERVLTDPARRGTWPAILWAMAHLRRADPETVLAILTGDHAIGNPAVFGQALGKAMDWAAASPAFVMMGIPPQGGPQGWSGFGCFRADDDGRVLQFQEKPTVDEASQMIRDGGWAWNSGMFFFKISTAEEALRRLQPEMSRIYEAMRQELLDGKTAAAAKLYEDFPAKIAHPLDPARYVDNSIDYAIMTPLAAGSAQDLVARAVCGIQFPWTDLGQWDALRAVLKADKNRNVSVGRVALKDVRQSIIVAGKSCRVEAEHVKDLIIGFDGATALVMAADQLPLVKEVAEEALRHPERSVVERDVDHCDVQAKAGQIVAIGLRGLSVQLSKGRLVVSPKRVL